MKKILKKFNKIAKKRDERIYLDYASLAPMSDSVKKELSHAIKIFKGNAGGLHKESLAALDVLSSARKSVADSIGALKDEIVFTSGGTEANNLAIRGALKAFKRKFPKTDAHIIVSSIEHASVLETCKDLELDGVHITYLPIDKDGFVSPKDVYESIRKETVLVSVIYANNEIGTIQPISEIAKAIRRWKKNNEADVNYPVFHTDACQAGNYLHLGVPQLGVDMMSVNGTKIYGPSGSGFLFVKRGTPILSMVTGGDQESGFRAGTESVPNAHGLSIALLEAVLMKDKESVRLIKMRDYFFSEIKKHIPEAIINGGMENRLPNNINITILGFQSEFLVISLDAHGFAVSGKSACKATDLAPSHVLEMLYKARGINMESNIGSLRITLGRDTQKAHLSDLIKSLKKVIDLQKRFI